MWVLIWLAAAITWEIISGIIANTDMAILREVEKMRIKKEYDDEMARIKEEQENNKNNT